MAAHSKDDETGMRMLHKLTLQIIREAAPICAINRIGVRRLRWDQESTQQTPLGAGDVWRFSTRSLYWGSPTLRDKVAPNPYLNDPTKPDGVNAHWFQLAYFHLGTLPHIRWQNCRYGILLSGKTQQFMSLGLPIWLVARGSESLTMNVNFGVW